MTWAWVLLWIGAGIATVVAFLAGAADDGRRAQLTIRWYGVRFADTPWGWVADAGVLVWLAVVYAAAGMFALVAGAAIVARGAADAGAARVSEPAITDEEG